MDRETEQPLERKHCSFWFALKYTCQGKVDVHESSNISNFILSAKLEGTKWKISGMCTVRKSF